MTPVRALERHSTASLGEVAPPPTPALEAVDLAVRLPGALVAALHAFMRDGRHSYVSRDEFVRVAVARHLQAAERVPSSSPRPRQQVRGGRPPARTLHQLYEVGWTLEEIGSVYGITPERVRQLFARAGLPTREYSRRAAVRREFESKNAEAMAEAYRRTGDLAAVSRRFGVAFPRARTLVYSLVPDPGRYRRTRSSKTYSDEDILWCLKGAADQVEGPLSGKEYTELARGRAFDDGRPWPARGCIENRFGSWRTALLRARLPANRSSGLGIRVRFRRDDCIEALRGCAGDLGHPPKAGEYTRWARGDGREVPGVSTIEKRCETWRNALRLALD